MPYNYKIMHLPLFEISTTPFVLDFTPFPFVCPFRLTPFGFCIFVTIFVTGQAGADVCESKYERTSFVVIPQFRLVPETLSSDIESPGPFKDVSKVPQKVRTGAIFHVESVYNKVNSKSLGHVNIEYLAVKLLHGSRQIILIMRFLQNY